ncbi:MAG: tetratricopeptide repeat protein [Armatimonadetes bacterium]|nr:tetratricopeptide repeat protein [Armatimonadota bacterium]
MKCKACGTEVSEDATYCTLCGVNLETGQRSDGDAPDSSVYPLLAAANLSRMRGNWDAAEQKCIEVLRLYPNNATAHSLLGDVYANQGRWEEAIQWYQLAADLDPGNQADRAKLDQARQRLVGGKEPPRRAAAGAPAGAPGRWGFLLRPRTQFGIIVALTCVVALLYLGTRRGPLRPGEGFGVALPGTSGASINRPAPDAVAPQPSPGAEPGNGADAPATPGNTAAPVPAAAGDAPAGSAAGRATEGSPAAAAPVASGPDLTQSEARALARLRAQLPTISPPGAGRIAGLLWDPMGSRAVVTVVFAQPLAAEALRDEAVRAAYRTGQALARIDIRNFQVIVKAVVNPGSGPEITLAAESSQASPRAWTLDAGQARSDALLPAFSNLWWHPQFR